MGQKDIQEKRLEEYNDVFADIYNTLLFGDIKNRDKKNYYLEEDKLRKGPGDSIYKMGDGADHVQDRDVLKEYFSGERYMICSFGIENQSIVDWQMPVRVLAYDSGSYKLQLVNQKKEVLLAPVITIILNFSDKKWDKATTLCEMLQIPKGLESYVQDYKIKVFDVAYLEDEIIDSFTSDFREVARFFKQKRLNGEFPKSRKPLKHPMEVVQFFAQFTKDKKYDNIIPEILKNIEQGGNVSMCNLADKLVNEGITKGITQGIAQGITQGIQALVEVCQEFGTTKEETCKKLLEKFGTTETQSRELVEKYWK